jgi:hypothetical protein
VAAGNGGDVVVLNRHRLPHRLELVLLLRPDVSNRNVETKDAALHSVDQLGQPFLQCYPLLTGSAASLSEVPLSTSRRVLEQIGEHGRRRRDPPRPESSQGNNGTVAGRDLETIFGAARTGEKIRRREHTR